MERYNGEGIPRDSLQVALRDRRQVTMARQRDACLLCRRRRVNEAGLCDACYGILEGEELSLALRWISGVGP